MAMGCVVRTLGAVGVRWGLHAGCRALLVPIVRRGRAGLEGDVPGGRWGLPGGGGGVGRGKQGQLFCWVPFGGRRLCCGVHGWGRYGFVVARAPDRYAPAAHTLTEALLPTTCVVVNKPPALKHFPTIGAQPRLSESRSRVPRNRRSGIPLRGACQKAGGNPARRKTPWGAHDRIGRASQPLGLLRLCRLVLHVHGGATGLGIHVTDGLDRVQPGLYP